jgi:hypothetical protein
MMIVGMEVCVLGIMRGWSDYTQSSDMRVIYIYNHCTRTDLG